VAVLADLPAGAMSDPVSDAMIGDLRKILSVSPLMKEAYDGLPKAQRKAVDSRFGEWIWEVILAAAAGGKA
jgi:hypothetical protein